MSFSCEILDVRKAIIIFKLKNSEDILLALEKEIKNNVGSMDYQTNVKGKMTGFNYFITNKYFNLLIKKWSGCSEQFQAMHSPITKINVKNAWGNILNKGDFVLQHDHLESTFNSILYFSNTSIVIEKKEINVKRGDIVTIWGFMKHYVNKDEHDNRVTLVWNWDPFWKRDWE
jgi:hypothetical protein